MGLVTSEKSSIASGEKVPFYINRNYAFLWSGQAISNLGDLIFDTTLMLWIATIIARGQSWAPLALGGAVLCTSVPTILFGPVVGVFVDRWDKKRTMIRMDLIRAFCVALLLFIAIPLPFLPTGQFPAATQLIAIYVIIFGTTVCSLFFSPARMSIIQEVVEQEYFERASGLALLTQNISRIIGPSLAAPTLFVFGIQWALLINAASFLVSAAAVTSARLLEHRAQPLKDKAQPKTRFWHEFKEGLLFLTKNRLLLILLAALCFLIISSSAEQTLGVFFMLSNLHVPVYLYGIIGTVGGAGGILGALVATYAVTRIGTLRSFWLSIVIFGLLLFLFARMTQFVPALVCIFLAGFPVAAANIALGPMLLRAIPRHLLGRVNAVFTTCTSAVSILAVSGISFLASLLHDLHARLLGFNFGPYDTVIAVSGLLTIMIGVGVALSLRNAATQQPTQQDNSDLKGDSDNG